MCFKLGQLSGISIVDKERPFSYAAVLLLLLLLCCVCCCCCWRWCPHCPLCVLNLGNSPEFQLLIRNVPLATRRCCCCCCCCCLFLLLLLAVGGVCFKLGQLSGISIVDKERPFSYAAVLLLLLLLQLLLLLLLLLLAVVVVCVLN